MTSAEASLLMPFTPFAPPDELGDDVGQGLLACAWEITDRLDINFRPAAVEASNSD